MNKTGNRKREGTKGRGRKSSLASTDSIKYILVAIIMLTIPKKTLLDLADEVRCSLLTGS